jgi:hypothetical protein
MTMIKRLYANKPVSYVLLLSQICLGVPLLLCYVLLPSVARQQAGVSNFGVQWPTSVLYSLGIAACAWFLWVAAIQIAGRFRPLAIGLAALSIVLLAVLLSTYPYKLSPSLNYLHKVMDFVLISVQLVLGLYLALRIHRARLSALLLTLQIIGTVLMYLTTLGLHDLFLSQQITEVSFGSLLVSATSYLPSP